MRRNCLALAVLVFLAASLCQGSNNIDSPLSIGLISRDITCTDEPVQFGSAKLEAARQATFEINIENSGKEAIRDIEVFAILPKGFKYMGYTYPGSLVSNETTDLAETREPPNFDEKQNTKIRWNIGGLLENEKKSIIIYTVFKCQIKEAQIKLAVLGNTSYSSVFNTSTWDGSLGECNCASIPKEDTTLLRINATLENDECGKWIRFGPGNAEAARLGIYKIDVQNIGKKSINNLMVYAILPMGMKYMSSQYSEPGQGDLDSIIEPQEFNEAQITEITWNVGRLQANDSKSILLNSYLKCPVNRTYIKLLATGYVEGQFTNSTIKNESIDLMKDCCCRKENIDIIINAILENEVCDKWIQFGPGNMEAARLGIYKIDVQNVGERSIDDLMVYANLPMGMKYMSSQYSEPGQGDLDSIIEPQEFNETQKTEITWNVGRLQANDSKSILLNSYLKCDVNKTNIELLATGYIEGQFTNSTIKIESIDLTKSCDCHKENIDIGIQVWEANSSTRAYFGTGCLKEAKLDIYNISVTNNGEVPLQKVKIIAEMPKGMMYINSSYYDSWRGKLIVSVLPNPIDFDENRTTKLIWSIGDLLPWEMKTIILSAYIKEDIKDNDIFAMVQGYSPYFPENEPVIDFADPVSDACSYREPSGAETTEALALLGFSSAENLIKTCLPWTATIDLSMLTQSYEATNINVTSEVSEADSNTMASFNSEKNETGKLNIFNITISNTGRTPLDNVEIKATMAQGMMFNSTAFSDPAWGQLNFEIDPIDFNEDLKTNLTWNIGCLQPGETKSILLEAYIKEDMDVNNTEISVMATGSLPDGSLVSSSSNKAMLKNLFK